jgi:hypothetical protein
MWGIIAHRIQECRKFETASFLAPQQLKQTKACDVESMSCDAEIQPEQLEGRRTQSPISNDALLVIARQHAACRVDVRLTAESCLLPKH